MENKAIVNKIIPFSNVDGPGNRLAIFFQSCNINCVYCHNPETINLCKKCMECIKGCPAGAIRESNGDIIFNEKLCVECDQCIRICSFGSSPKTKVYNVEGLLKEIEEYRLFIRGITVSGGEPTLQHKFIAELFKKVKGMGLTCFVDTNGFFDRENIAELIEATDKFMVDIKAVDRLKEVCNTEFNNNLENLEYLLKKDKVYEVRTVLVEEYLDMENTVRTVASMLKNYKNVIYKLIRVHSQGLRDEQKKLLEGKVPTVEGVQRLAAIARELGVDKVEVIGI